LDNIQILLTELFNITIINLGIKKQPPISSKTERISTVLNTGILNIKLPLNNNEHTYIMNKKFPFINYLSIIYR